MYDDAMDAIHEHLILQSTTRKITFTAELVPEQNRRGEMLVIFVSFTTNSFRSDHGAERRSKIT
jgi:hypothetical protein